MRWAVLVWLVLSVAVLALGFLVDKSLFAFAPAVIVGPPFLAAMIFARAIGSVLIGEVIGCLSLLGRLWAPRYLLVVGGGALALELAWRLGLSHLALLEGEYQVLLVRQLLQGLIGLAAAIAIAAPVKAAVAVATPIGRLGEAPDRRWLEQFLDGPGRGLRKAAPWVLVAVFASRLPAELGIYLPISAPGWLLTFTTVGCAGLWAAPLLVPARPRPPEELLSPAVIEQLAVPGVDEPGGRRVWLSVQPLMGVIGGPLAVAWIEAAQLPLSSALGEVLSRPVLLGAIAGGLGGSIARTEKGSAIVAPVIAAPAAIAGAFYLTGGPFEQWVWLLAVPVLAVFIEMGSRLARGKPAPGVIPVHPSRAVPAPVAIAVAAGALLLAQSIPWLIYTARAD